MLNEFTVLTGQLSSFYDLKIKGRLSLFSIVFKPYGLSVFFDIPVREIFNQNVPLKFLVKDKTNELEERLSKALSFEDRKSIAEQFLFERLTKSKTKYHFDRIKESVGIINNSKGTVNIEKLANVACFSRKQFERTFLDYVGISPKKFMRIVRFQHSIFTKSKNANISLTDLTYCSGYYDQSHMTNNFLKLTGMGPKQYFKECEPFSDYFH